MPRTIAVVARLVVADPRHIDCRQPPGLGELCRLTQMWIFFLASLGFALSIGLKRSAQGIGVALATMIALLLGTVLLALLTDSSGCDWSSPLAYNPLLCLGALLTESGRSGLLTANLAFYGLSAVALLTVSVTRLRRQLS